MKLVLNAVPVRRGSQDEHQSYLASLTFGNITRLLDDGRLYVPNQPDLPDLAQRRPNKVRIKAIAQYILETYQDSTTFFPPICVNVQPAPSYREGNIFMPYYSVTLRLTDGQHRCYGIRAALKKIQEQSLDKLHILSQLEIGVLLYAGLCLEEEQQAFRDQNLLVQRPSISLSHHFDRRSPAVLITKALQEQVPQFFNNVEAVENSLGKHNPKLMTLSTLVTATKHMFPHLQSKKDLEPQIDWAAAFWEAAALSFPDDPWPMRNSSERAQQRQESLAVSAVVFQALGLLGRDLLQEGIPAADVGKWLTKLQEIEWRRDNEFWLERGVTQVGEAGKPITSNTKTTVNACHKVLCEFVGVVSVAGAIA